MFKFRRFRSDSSTPDDEVPAGPAPDDATVILLVEDEPVVRGLFATSLRREGYYVVEARNGAEGLDTAQRVGRIDLVVSDIVMPVMKGPELAVKLRELYPGLRFLFVSSYLVEEQLGPNTDMLQKPFKQEQLIRKVVEIIGPPKPTQSAAS
jgi:two-component system cell cycle sensor histidine kinase/response regulator CckA